MTMCEATNQLGPIILLILAILVFLLYVNAEFESRKIRKKIMQQLEEHDKK